MMLRLYFSLLNYRKGIILSAVILVSLVGISGWVFDIMSLTGNYKGYIPMAPLTAILFLLLSFSLYIKKAKYKNGFVSLIPLLIVLVFSLIIFAQQLLWLQGDIERVFGIVGQSTGSFRLGRMSHVTSLLFIFTILSLIFQDLKIVFLKGVSDLIAILLFGYDCLLILGYIYNAPFFYGGKFIPVALPTSLAFLLINFYVIDEFKISLIPQNFRKNSGIANLLAKVFLPASIIIFMVHGFIEGHFAHNSNNKAVISFITLVTTIALLTITILYISRRLGAFIEKIENEKLRMQQENHEELTRQMEEYYSLYEKYKAINEELYQRNEELRKSNLHLIESEKKAEESDRLKTAFLQNMSHEIRTPMNSIMGFAQLLPENLDNKEKLMKFSNIIKQRTSDLLEIINEILDISKIESGELSVHFQECDLKYLFNELYEMFKVRKQETNQPGVEFIVNIGCELAESRITTDAVKLRQILINLINNAFKFTTKGKIEAGCYYNEDKAFIFYVSDTGQGIPKEKQSIIFQRFTQLNTSEPRNQGGTGLGLAIVKGLIDLLGGHIWLESEPGMGSKFYFEIPYESLIGQHKIQKSPPKNIQYHFRNKNLLIVEDDVFNAQYLKEMLTNTGFKIFHCEFGLKAVELANIHPLDIILMDIRLPDIDGYAAAMMIKSVKPLIKIIAQTAYAMEKDRQKAFKNGCDDFISKPIEKNNLLAIIHKHLNVKKIDEQSNISN